jgi:hypothetical protein
MLGLFGFIDRLEADEAMMGLKNIFWPVCDTRQSPIAI